MITPPFVKPNPLIIVFLIALHVSCGNRATSHHDLISTSQERAKNENFDWMIGDWTRINEEANKATFETWTKKDPSHYIGFSYTMQDRDTVWQETVDLVKANGNWSFDVKGKGETHATKFRLITIEDERFVAENQANEFPKVIKYWKKEHDLHAKFRVVIWNSFLFSEKGID